MKRALLLMLVLAPAAACASAQAKSPAERPNLEVPPPPPRIIEPMPVEQPPPEPIDSLPAASPTTRTRPPAAAREPVREPAKPDPKPEVPPETPPAPSPPAPQLRTPTVPDGPAAARQIREIIDRTGRMLNSIDYQTLSTERKNSYNTAKNFMKEGEEALKGANYLYAKELADKAERLAKELQGR